MDLYEEQDTGNALRTINYGPRCKNIAAVVGANTYSFDRPAA